jgi:(p)ppGpp synthase/HD superfamily hydrolase
MQPISKAVILATAVHDYQYRKGNNKLPYITHPLSVFSRLKKVLEFNSQSYDVPTTDLLICAVLHDVYEDVDIKSFEIAKFTSYVNCEPSENIRDLVKQLFGETVHKIIAELSNEEYVDKTEYLKQKLTKVSQEAFLIKCIDRLDNLEDCKTMTNEAKQKLYKDTYNIWRYVSENRKCNLDHTVIIANIMTICKNNTTD